MIVVMERGASDRQVDEVVKRLKEFGFDIHLSRGVERTIIGAIGEKKSMAVSSLEVMDGVERIVPILQPFKLAGREFKPEKTVVRVGGVEFGGNRVPVIAGPCAVESEEQLLEAARAVKEAGASVLRGGAYKPRTSPYSFQGLEETGLALLAEARRMTGLPVVTEVVNPRDVELVSRYVDMLQVGARNMQNFVLLREVGRAKKPVLLKRGLAATIAEWLMAAEYIVSAGNYDVILCERGIRTYETSTRNTLDLSAVAEVQRISHLPVLVDPSHSTGKWRLVGPMSKAAIAAGADGLIIEVHPNPELALSDGPQSLKPEKFAQLMGELAAVAEAVGRCL
ncbi:MAG: 3-deoxy-7-phosphoheptulonate synthase [Limnochordia bacterium]|jgi:3-deoxy-7-phosphoheptulonate synthase|nr:3-deoxy-7-phosphoheptulonate synthase [Bacillota bacterium]